MRPLIVATWIEDAPVNGVAPPSPPPTHAHCKGELASPDYRARWERRGGQRRASTSWSRSTGAARKAPSWATWATGACSERFGDLRPAESWAVAPLLALITGSFLPRSRQWIARLIAVAALIAAAAAVSGLSGSPSSAGLAPVQPDVYQTNSLQEGFLLARAHSPRHGVITAARKESQ